MHGICALCQDETNLKESHLIPKFIFDYFAIKKHIKLQLSYVNFIKLVVKALTYSNTAK